MKEVIILGSGYSATECPFDTELWATAAMLPNIDPDCTKVFAFGELSDASKEGLEIAQREGIPIVSTESYATERFPYEEIVKEFKIEYFRVTAAYMIAYAIYLGYEKIRLYGIDKGDEWDYVKDQPRITYWLGVAKGRGIFWEIAEESKLHKILKENVKKRYKGIKAIRALLHDKELRDHVGKVRADGQPYCFVSGIDQDAIKVTVREDGGKEIVQKCLTT